MGDFSTSKRYGLTASQRRIMRDRLDSLEADMQKEASDVGSAFLLTAAGGLAGSAVAYGVPAAIKGIKNSKLRANKKKNLEGFIYAHPEIRNYSKRDIDLVYNSLAIHAPNLLQDPLLGGQTMLDALRRGTNMDVGSLSNVSKLTGGSGLQDHEQAAVDTLARGMTETQKSYGKYKFDKLRPSRSGSSSNSGDKGGKKGKGGRS